jgi:hypothetical protein
MSNDTTALAASTIILSPASQFFVDSAGITIAPWVLGTLADLFLQGELVFIAAVPKATSLYPSS